LVRFVALLEQFHDFQADLAIVIFAVMVCGMLEHQWRSFQRTSKAAREPKM
jgi:hypothetical protein